MTTDNHKYSTFNRNANNPLTEPMFLGNNVNVSRYDQQKHEIFEKLIEKQLSFFWRPEEIDIGRDRIDFLSLPDHEKHIFLSNLKYQTLLDSIQGRSPNVALLPLVSIPELETWIETWAFSECLEKNTEVLTSKGWKSIADVTTNDSILVFNPETQKTHFETPKRTTSYEVKNRHLLKLSSHNFTQVVTPNHRMPIFKANTNEHYFTEAAYWNYLGDYDVSPLVAPVSNHGLNKLIQSEMKSNLFKIAVFNVNDCIQQKTNKSTQNKIQENLTQLQQEFEIESIPSLVSDNEIISILHHIQNQLDSFSSHETNILANFLAQWFDDFSGNEEIKQLVKDLIDALATLSGLITKWLSDEFHVALLGHGNSTLQTEETWRIKPSVEFYEDTHVYCVETTTGAFVIRDKHNEQQHISITGNTIHSRSYTHIIRNIINDPSVVFDDIVQNEHILKRAEDIACYYDDLIEYSQYYQLLGEGKHIVNGKEIVISLRELKKKLFLCLICVNVLEAVRFYVSFACSFAFAEREKMEGNAKIIKLIARDEALHLTGTQHMINLILFNQDDPEMAEIANELKPEMIEIFKAAAEQEKEWAEYLFKDGSMLGLNKNILCQYVEFITNNRMMALGLPILYPNSTQNPIAWINSWLTSDNVQVAPQEVEISAYLTGQVDANINQEELSDFDL